MLFNSYAFLFVFLPVALAGYFLLGRLGRGFGSGWLALCSLFFYGWWDWHYLPLLLASIVGNYLVGGQIARQAGSAAGKRTLIAGVAANLALLGYYKYADFFIRSGNAVLGPSLGVHWPELGVVLPIGISFFTFTQIAFLADAYAGKVTEVRFSYYTLFVTYFPHLIAGPVLHHKEMMPQFDDASNYRPQAANLAIGASIFAIGLAKKVLVADNLAGYASPAFAPGAAALSLVDAWGAALAYTFQLYFDFSGYSDMAIGLSRLFGVRLPLNFHSPYRSVNISEFWRRWHMTLSRFLRDYLYIPLGGNRHGATRRHLNLMTTMVLGGLWHGAGWNFVIWGALHGAYLVVNHAWQGLKPRAGWMPGWLARTLGVALTFFCVVVAWVYFRAPDLATAHRILGGMAGLHGVALPLSITQKLGGLWPQLQAAGVTSYLGGGGAFIETWMWVAIGAVLAFGCPNTQQIMGRFEPAIADDREAPLPQDRRWQWQPRPAHAVLLGLLLAAGVMALTRPTEFLYFQF